MISGWAATEEEGEGSEDSQWLYRLELANISLQVPSPLSYNLELVSHLICLEITNCRQFGEKVAEARAEAALVVGF